MDGKKRPIDQRRGSAGSMTVGFDDEGKIAGFLKFGDERLLIIKEKAIYEVMLADKVDPERVNEKIPNVQQRIFNVGSTDKTVQAILIQTSKLLEGGFLRDLDTNEIGALALACCSEALAIQRIYERIEADQKECTASVKGSLLTNGFIIPTLHDIEQDMKSVLNRADHFGAAILQITRKFVGKVASFESLLSKEKGAGAESPEGIKVLGELVSFLRFVREARNSMEHPTADRHIEVKNFELSSAGQLVAPTFEHIHKKYPQPRIAITIFLRQFHDALVELFTVWIARLAGQKIYSGSIPVAVMTIPENRREFFHARYGYGINTSDGLMPVG